jgi:hypothetical protein
MAAKSMAYAFESRSQFTEIIDFAVKDNYVPPARGVHGLMTVRRKIENRKPPVPQGNAGLTVNPRTRIIGTAVDQLIGHPCDHNLHLELSFGGGCNETGYSTHRWTFRFIYAERCVTRADSVCPVLGGT